MHHSDRAISHMNYRQRNDFENGGRFLTSKWHVSAYQNRGDSASSRACATQGMFEEGYAPVRSWSIFQNENVPSGVARMFGVRGQRTLRATRPSLFFYLPFLLFSLSVGTPFSSGAPGHCPPMPPT